MNPFLFLLRRMPPVRVLIGAGLAFASYFVTNVWKAAIDDEIKSYSSIVDRASSFEMQSASLPRFQATTSYSFDANLLQQTQINAIYLLGAAMGHSIGTPDYAIAPNIQENRAIGQEAALLSNFFATLPPIVMAQAVTQNDPLLIPGQNGSSVAAVIACISTLYLQDTNVEAGAIAAAYDKEFADAYTERASAESNTDQYPPTIYQAAFNLITKLKIGDFASGDIAGIIEPAINPLDPAPSSSSSVPVSSSAAKKAIFDNHRFRALRCIDNARDQVLDNYFNLSMELRRVIAANLIDPLSKTRRKVEAGEVALYIISGVIALFGAEPAPILPRKQPIGPRGSINGDEPRFRKPRRPRPRS